MLVTLNLIRYKKLCQVQSNVPCIIKLIIYMYVYTRDKKKMFQMDDDLQKEIELRDYSLNFAKRVS